MPKRILIEAVHPEEVRVVVTEDSRLQDFDFESSAKKQIKGNIYLAKVSRVEPSLQAAFIEYGGNKQGFLPFSEIHPDYYQIPASDKPNERPEQTSVPETSSPHLSEPQSAEDLAQIEEYRNPDEGSFAHPENAEHHEERQASEHQNNERSDGGEDDRPSQEIDVIGEETYNSAKKSNLYRRYKIQEVIKRNQVLLVQVIKEERGNKGASLTTYISLAGRYIVLMPNSERQGGVSRRIADNDDRRRLKVIAESFELPEGTSMIIRTAGLGSNKADIKRDYEYLSKLWEDIREKTLSSKAPALIHEEGDLIKRTIRDLYDNSIDEIMVEGETAFEAARDFMKILAPGHSSKVKPYKENIPIFWKYGIETEIAELYDSKAQLRSGGYIVINSTEALVAIDVNSGRSTRERNVEETATKTNLEAAYEIARQLRLRDLAGLIVVDFIDMMEGRNRRAVERALKDALQADRAKIQIGRISPFGLLEMSRQRLRSSFIEANMVQCAACNGTGVIRSPESTVVGILRAVDSEASKSSTGKIKVSAPSDIAFYLLNKKREDLVAIEQRHNVKVTIESDKNLVAQNFTIESGAGKEQKFNSESVREEYRGSRHRGGYKESNAPKPEETDSPKEETFGGSGNVTSVETDSGGRSGGGGGRRRNRGRKKRFDHDGPRRDGQNREGHNRENQGREGYNDNRGPRDGGGGSYGRGGGRDNRRRHGVSGGGPRYNNNNAPREARGNEPVPVSVSGKKPSVLKNLWKKIVE